ncbi:MAG: protein-methionine-sulfoxide reductase catalytic subunit MsrP [Acidisphaera sp.]|nr:protein-methionine-sulfoxide reductase catalytic subunit MsrP [Acidisphaera sp.]
MLLRNPRSWEIAEARATPERVAIARRPLIKAALGVAATGLALPARAQSAPVTDPRFSPGRAITAEADSTTYNNYYEFGDSKDIVQQAQKLPQAPWSISLAGMVDKPRTIALEDLLTQVSLEERVYRHRCVEAWAMTVPWTGFPLTALLRIAQPTASAKYVVFETVQDRKTMPGLRQSWYPWPYIEGVTMAEAANELPFLATGMYGKKLPPQDGGPIRLLLPWKYGFKSAKAIIKITFTDQRPVNFWQAINPDEYGFWANVNPAVPHPRWSQATERLLGSDERVPTKLFNGYGEVVASLYTNLTSEKLYM